MLREISDLIIKRIVKPNYCTINLHRDYNEIAPEWGVFNVFGVFIVVTETKNVRIEMHFTWRKEKECCKADAKLQKISDMAKDF